jgi:hypothetical protein
VKTGRPLTVGQRQQGDMAFNNAGIMGFVGHVDPTV